MQDEYVNSQAVTCEKFSVLKEQHYNTLFCMVNHQLENLFL